MFTRGSPGLGLGLLRVSVAESLMSNAPTLLIHQSIWVILVLCVLSLGLFLGFLTRTLSLLAVGAQIVAALRLGFDPVRALISVPAALAIALLGPGAYSVDGYLFGRKVLIWPPRDGEGSQP